MMATSTQITAGTVASSGSSTHSSGSQSSLFDNGTGGPYIHQSFSPLRPTVTGRSGSVAHIRMISNPAEYLLPGAEPGSYVLYAIAGARIYHSTQLTSNHNGALGFRWSAKDRNNGNQWVYSHLKGTLVFGRDRDSAGVEAVSVEKITAPSCREGGANGEWWFQLVDDEAGKIVWKFKLPLGPGSKFRYELDRPFFHVFKGSSRKYGFLFEDDKESVTFSEEVTLRARDATAVEPKSSKGRSRSLSIKSNKKLKLKDSSSCSPQAAGVSATVVSSPTPDSFKHIAHVGFNQTSGAIETSKNLDPAFREILADLRMQIGSEVTENVVLEHLDFVQGFWKDAGTVQRSMSSRPIPAN